MTARLIEILQDSPGFKQFIGSWVYMGDITFIVDVGPANTTVRLIDTLESLGVDRLDYILLTHIHIDHAGGPAEVLERYSSARVIYTKQILPHQFQKKVYRIPAGRAISRLKMGPVALW